MRRALAVLGLLTAFLAGCGDDKADEAATATTARAAAPTAQKLHITGMDFAFDAPAGVQGGWLEIEFVNTGKEPHMTGLARVKDGKILKDVLDALEKSRENENALDAAYAEDGEVLAPQAISPGYAATSFVKVEPGTYALACFIPSPDGKQHFSKGMVKMLTVAGDAGGTEPKADAKLTFAGGKLTGPATLKPGRHVFEVDGPGEHELIAIAGLNGKTAAEGKAYIEKAFGGEGPPPAGPGDGALLLQLHNFTPDKDNVYVALDLKAGEVAFFCEFIPRPEGASGVESDAEKHKEALTIKVA